MHRVIAVALLLVWLGFYSGACKRGGQEPNVPPPGPTDAGALSSEIADSTPGDASLSAPAVMVNDLDDGGGTVPEASAPAPPADFSAPLNYPAASLKETFAKNAQKFRACYLPGKKRDGKLRGKVIVKFTINTAGRSTFAANEGSNLPDDAVIACVVRLVKSLRYAKPDEGTVTVIYPFIFRPWEETVILPESAPAK